MRTELTRIVGDSIVAKSFLSSNWEYKSVYSDWTVLTA